VPTAAAADVAGAAVAVAAADAGQGASAAVADVGPVVAPVVEPVVEPDTGGVAHGAGKAVKAVAQGVGVNVADGSVDVDPGAAVDAPVPGESVGVGVVVDAGVVNSELADHAEAEWPWAALTETSMRYLVDGCNPVTLTGDPATLAPSACVTLCPLAG
jgi:hypothetical protein